MEGIDVQPGTHASHPWKGSMSNPERTHPIQGRDRCPTRKAGVPSMEGIDAQPGTHASHPWKGRTPKPDGTRPMDRRGSCLGPKARIPFMEGTHAQAGWHASHQSKGGVSPPEGMHPRRDGPHAHARRHASHHWQERLPDGESNDCKDAAARPAGHTANEHCPRDAIVKGVLGAGAAEAIVRRDRPPFTPDCSTLARPTDALPSRRCERTTERAAGTRGEDRPLL
jgi:hypothetical protein